MNSVLAGILLVLGLIYFIGTRTGKKKGIVSGIVFGVQSVYMKEDGLTGMYYRTYAEPYRSTAENLNASSGRKVRRGTFVLYGQR
ncbi:MAG: hypothetical protein MR407_01895 [Roseburia sp.]|nr:hypothetical protein [Roseburia sp.]